jgi:hypothetical protein
MQALLLYIQRNTGHGLTARYNTAAGYENIQSFLMSKELGPSDGSIGYQN